MNNLNYFNYKIADTIADADHGQKFTPEIWKLANEISYKINLNEPGIKIHIDELIKKYPEVPVFRHMLTMHYRNNGDVDKASVENKNTLKLFPDYVIALTYLAHEYIDTGQLHKMEDVLGHSLEIGNLFPERRVFFIGEIVSFNFCVISYLIAKNELPLADERFKSFKILLGEFERVPGLNISSLDDDMMFAKIRAGIPVEGIPVPELQNPLLLELFCNSLRISHDIIEKILELPHKFLIGDLAIILRNCNQNFEDWEIMQNDVRIIEHPVHALFLLAEIADETSLPLVLEILEWPEDMLEFWFNDFLTSDYWKIIYQVENNQTEELLSFILKPDIYFYSRTVISQVMVHIVLLQPHRRDEVIKWYRKLLNEINTNADLLNNKHQIPAAFYLSDLADIHGVELEQEMVQTHNLYLSEYDEMFGGMDKMLSALHLKDNMNVPNDPFPGIYLVYEECLSDWNFYQSGEDLDQQERIRSGEEEEFEDEDWEHEEWDEYEDVENDLRTSSLVSPSVPGRNEPCYCGSGKKYKKCCLLN